MKKVLTIIFVCLLLFSCKKKEEEIIIEPEVTNADYSVSSLDDILSYKVLDDYSLVDTYYLNDFNEDLNIDGSDKIVVERNYESEKSWGYFSVEMFSYKKQSISTGFDKINEEDYINRLVRTTTKTIDNHKFIIGYSGEDDYDDVIGRAYVKHNNYVILFSMRNSDEAITDTQYKEFINMIETVRFK